MAQPLKSMLTIGKKEFILLFAAMYGSVTDMIPFQLFGTKYIIFNLADVYLLGIFVTYRNVWKKH